MMTDEPKPLDPARPVRTPEVESRVDQLFLDLLISVGRWRRTLMKNGAKAARTRGVTAIGGHGFAIRL